jgi:RES domain-containing protein
MKIPLQHVLAAILPVKPLTGTWYRAIPPIFLQTALKTSHSRTVPGRFNDGSSTSPAFSVLYLAEDPMLALFEVEALYGSPAPGKTIPNPRRSTTILNVNVTLNAVADLTRIREQFMFDTNVQELTGDWRGFKIRSPSTSVKRPTGIAPTQELGAALYGVPGLEGFLAVSAKLSYQMILVVFPDKLPNPAGMIEHVDDFGNIHPLTS